MFLKCIVLLFLIKYCLSAAELKDSCDCCCAIDHLCKDAVVMTKCQKTCAPNIPPLGGGMNNTIKIVSKPTSPTEPKKPIRNDLSSLTTKMPKTSDIKPIYDKTGTLTGCTVGGNKHLVNKEFKLNRCKKCKCNEDQGTMRTDCSAVANCLAF